MIVPNGNNGVGDDWADLLFLFVGCVGIDMHLIGGELRFGLEDKSMRWTSGAVLSFTLCYYTNSSVDTLCSCTNFSVGGRSIDWRVSTSVVRPNN